jgi:6-pyruvoyltetrahydropterin/6-carboxytetrahydropterin synthase|tara:strand:- start:68 stop:631 length:564 start_codon:yes stop_codon:yes gene_type:complete
MTHIIDKTFEFCYGHRVWTQVLDGEYADNLKCACRHLHGHEGKVQVFLTADDLNKSGMITDFRHLEWLKKWINEYIDHQFILDKNDPLYNQIIDTELYSKLNPVQVKGCTSTVGWTFDLSSITPSTPSYEYYEGFMIVDFVPTSENLSKWLCDLVEEKMFKLGVSVHHIDWWETPKSRSVYYNDRLT